MIFTGLHANIIVPPSWIIKLPRKGSFKSSLRKTPKKRDTSHKKSKEKESKAFMIKPIPTTKVSPVLVFINPKSGGNQVHSLYYLSTVDIIELYWFRRASNYCKNFNGFLTHDKFSIWHKGDPKWGKYEPPIHVFISKNKQC